MGSAHHRLMKFPGCKLCVSIQLAIIVFLLAGCEVLTADIESLPGMIAIRQVDPTISPGSTGNLTNPAQPASPPTTDPYTLAVTKVNSNSVDLYSLLELDLQTNLQVSNPYNPNEIDLKMRFTAPSGRVVEVGAFWYQGFGLRSREPKGEPGWKVRFTPDETGDWHAMAYVPALGLNSAPFSFKVIPSSHPGFVRIHPTNPHFLAFDNGDFFFPIGLNMGWWGGCCNPIEQYAHWLDEFSSNGGNTIRVWMAAWSFGIEWKDTGLGDYDQRQYEAWLLDQLFQLAEEHGVKVILVLVNHGPLSLVANSEWKDNPYNAALGGPLSNPGQFVTDPSARAYYQQRLSYVINRWAYSPELLAWEWFNEVDLTPISDEELVPWIQDMTAYLRQRDVNHHLTTNSFAVRCWSQVWQLPELDIVQKHDYSDQIFGNERDLAGRASQEFQALAQAVPDKPILLGEFSYSAANYGDDVEKTGIHLHNGLWATTFSGFAGTGMYWWWDVYIETNNLWKHFNALSRFIDGEDLSQYQPFSPLILPGAKGAPVRADGLGLRGEKTMVWLRSDSYTVQTFVAMKNEAHTSSAPILPVVKDLSLTLDGMADGEYSVSWYDPQLSRWMEQVSTSAQNYTLTVPIPPFQYDLAVKISRHP